MVTAISHEVDVDQLRILLRRELSAVETYDRALERFASEPRVAATLSDCRESHELRAEALRRQVEQLNGEAWNDSGVWDLFAKLIEGGAQPLNAKAEIAALEDGERRERAQYEAELDALSPAVRAFVERRLLPEQLRTQEALFWLAREP